MRLFVGVPLAAAAIDELAAIQARLRTKGDSLRWSSPETWHVTLQFLGNTGQEQYACTVARLRELRMPPVPMALEGLGFFDRAGVFFAGVRITPELLLLHERVTGATELCGFVPESRAFQPHITLARSKGQQKSFLALKAKLPRQPNFSSFVAEEFLLYESFLGAGGSRYEIRGHFPLGCRQGPPPQPGKG